MTGPGRPGKRLPVEIVEGVVVEIYDVDFPEDPPLQAPAVHVGNAVCQQIRYFDPDLIPPPPEVLPDPDPCQERSYNSGIRTIDENMSALADTSRILVISRRRHAGRNGIRRRVFLSIVRLCWESRKVSAGIAGPASMNFGVQGPQIAMPAVNSRGTSLACPPDAEHAFKNSRHHRTRDLHTTELTILPAEFAVAQNSAVRLTGRDRPFIPEQPALMLPAAAILHIHERCICASALRNKAGQRLSPGPSQTADIERSPRLVTHGPRSMTVYLLV